MEETVDHDADTVDATEGGVGGERLRRCRLLLLMLLPPLLLLVVVVLQIPDDEKMAVAPDGATRTFSLLLPAAPLRELAVAAVVDVVVVVREGSFSRLN